MKRVTAIELLGLIAEHLHGNKSFGEVTFECDNDSGELVIVVDTQTFVISSGDVKQSDDSV